MGSKFAVWQVFFVLLRSRLAAVCAFACAGRGFRGLCLMRRLMMLRHATAVPHGSMPDFERVLTDQGRQDAAVMASYCKDEMLWPDLALVSPAARTRATHEAFMAAGGGLIVSGCHKNSKNRDFLFIYVDIA